MKDEETLQELIRLKEALARSDNETSDSGSSIDIYMGNRGRKLKRKARYAYRGKLGVPSSILTDRKTVHYGYKKRMVIQRKKMHSDSADKDDEELTNSDDPYKDIHIDELLAPISHPADLSRRRSYHRSLTRSYLENLSKKLLDAISEEHAYNIKLSKLLFVLLGDDTSMNMDMNVVDNENEEMENQAIGLGIDQQSERQNDCQIEEQLKHDQPSEKANLTVDDISQPVTRQHQSFTESSLATDEDLFLELNRRMGLSKNDVSDLRKLLQSALDRSNEYLKCLMQARNGIALAERLMKKVYEWCTEMAKKEE